MNQQSSNPDLENQAQAKKKPVLMKSIFHQINLDNLVFEKRERKVMPMNFQRIDSFTKAIVYQRVKKERTNSEFGFAKARKGNHQ